MSNYVQITTFTAKDSLASGNPSKLVKGSEIDAELSAISTAITSKYDSGSGVALLAGNPNLFTGTQQITKADDADAIDARGTTSGRFLVTPWNAANSSVLLRSMNLAGSAYVAQRNMALTYNFVTSSTGTLADIQFNGTALSTTLALYPLKSNNLSDLGSAVTARTNLGLGSLATLSSVNDSNWSGTALAVGNGGTGSGTAAGARTNLGVTATGADTTYCFRSNNLSDVTAATARTNLGVTATGADTTYAFRSNNLSDLGSAATARTNLGVGSMATRAVTIQSGGSPTGGADGDVFFIY